MQAGFYKKVAKIGILLFGNSNFILYNVKANYKINLGVYCEKKIFWSISNYIKRLLYVRWLRAFGNRLKQGV